MENAGRAKGAKGAMSWAGARKNGRGTFAEVWKASNDEGA